jgi:hypothetical protein
LACLDPTRVHHLRLLPPQPWLQLQMNEWSSQFRACAVNIWSSSVHCLAFSWNIDNLLIAIILMKGDLQSGCFEIRCRLDVEYMRCSRVVHVRSLNCSPQCGAYVIVSF